MPQAQSTQGYRARAPHILKTFLDQTDPFLLPGASRLRRAGFGPTLGDRPLKGHFHGNRPQTWVDKHLQVGKYRAFGHVTDRRAHKPGRVHAGSGAALPRIRPQSFGSLVHAQTFHLVQLGLPHGALDHILGPALQRACNLATSPMCMPSINRYRLVHDETQAAFLSQFVGELSRHDVQ